ncbi:two-component system, LytT family, response regulator [Catalinimonas alkaloidigena]|uniref:Two-component system, LytT family, response regulator n=1 Tax=Catalinimonas alkaloidigena TaxID=1075417 RepID=A0A1G9IUD6_9BACT|nr:LytTR family DNA-binding domain-containing protein [Catalinimonas alkaloidigena]SDL28721.1 two-component system, LytT family, response regulator [Catalinimonas alkaloidigena]
MEILIVEDEKPALQRLMQAVERYDPAIRIAATPGSVREAVRWLIGHPAPDLILLDIQLSDGLSLDIFQECAVACPVIFTTAYDEYMVDAFQHNGIDYLLKPIRQEKLERALNKYLKLQTHFTTQAAISPDLFARLGASVAAPETATETYKSRVLVRKGVEFLAIRTEDVAWFFSTHKVVFLVDRAGTRYLTDKTLTELENELDPDLFFRANRQYIVHVDGVARFRSAGKGKISLELTPPAGEAVVISQERAGVFRSWLER